MKHRSPSVESAAACPSDSSGIQYVPASSSQDSQEEKQNFCKTIWTNSTFIILMAAVLGFGIGIAISDNRASPTVVSWIALPGELFLRALKCIVLPLVFVNIITAVIEMLQMGKALSIGWKTIAMYTFTTAVAGIEGLICVLFFKPYFTDQTTTTTNGFGDDSNTFGFHVACSNSGLLSTSENGSIACLPHNNNTTTTTFSLLSNVTGNVLSWPTSTFDTNTGPADDISLSQTLQDGIFRKMVPENLMEEFTNANFVGLIAFAIVFAVASQRVNTCKSPESAAAQRTLLSLLTALDDILLVMINGVIYFTAPAVVSLVAGALGARSDLVKVFSDLGVLLGATLTAMGIHLFVFFPILFYVTVKKSMFPFFKSLSAAQSFAFASSSSAATLPVTMECVASTSEVPESISNFVLALGATINMDGGAIYFPTAIVFLAVSSGVGDELSIASYFLILLLCTIGSAGTAPVPSGSLVLIITAFNTVFDSSGTPDTFSYILALDWFMDRCRTVMNITGDALMARIITAMCTEGETPIDSELELVVNERTCSRIYGSGKV